MTTRTATHTPTEATMLDTYADLDDIYSAEREREDALFFESQPYSYYATADAEAHWLFTNGHTSYCSCNSCELAADAAAQEEGEAWYWDFEASIDQIDQLAQDLFDSAEQHRAREFAPLDDPWGPAPAPWDVDSLPF